MLGAASSPNADVQGWLYQLLRWAGVGQSAAARVQQVLVKPLSVGLVILGALLFGWLGSRIIRRWIAAAVRRAAARSDSPRAQRRAVTLTAMAANIWRVVVGVVAFFVALGAAGLDLTPLLAGATIIGATIGFGAQSIVKDFLSGFLLTAEAQFDIGDTICVGTTTGVVEDLTLRVTRLRGADGVVWYLPNGDIRLLGNTVRGWGRATVDVPAAPAVGVDRLLAAVQGAADDVHADPNFSDAFLEAPVVWGLVDAAVDSITARVTARTAFDRRDAVERAIREAVVRRLEPPSADGGAAPSG
ncbi:MAG TPA: mechanosensitive ion channel domain-containing protein [Acidimicrobiales bacterium]|nr:mechanosensitive ion channel domain-containing protein [Acidimicrobiales bacterium]